MTADRAHIAYAGDRIGAKLSFKRQLKLLRIGQYIFRREIIRTGNRFYFRPWKGRVGIAGRYIGWRKYKRECVWLNLSSLTSDIRRSQQRWPRACIEEPIRCVADFYKPCRVDDGGIEDSIPGADTGFAGATNQFTQKTIGDVRRDCNTDSRSEVRVLDRRQGARNSWIQWNDQACRRAREGKRLFSLDEGL